MRVISIVMEEIKGSGVFNPHAPQPCVGHTLEEGKRWVVQQKLAMEEEALAGGRGCGFQ